MNTEAGDIIACIVVAIVACVHVVVFAIALLKVASFIL